jgi:hypothetical protein
MNGMKASGKDLSSGPFSRSVGRYELCGGVSGLCLADAYGAENDPVKDAIRIFFSKAQDGAAAPDFDVDAGSRAKLKQRMRPRAVAEL